MNECIVEGCINVGNTENEFSLCDLWPERDGGFFPDYFSLLWWLYAESKLHELLLSRFRKIVTDHFVVIDKIGLFGLDQTSARLGGKKRELPQLYGNMK
jgi:hypothetical protein